MSISEREIDRRCTLLFVGTLSLCVLSLALIGMIVGV